MPFTAGASPAQLVKAGQEIYKTKGTCEICHQIIREGECVAVDPDGREKHADCLKKIENDPKDLP